MGLGEAGYGEVAFQRIASAFTQVCDARTDGLKWSYALLPDRALGSFSHLHQCRKQLPHTIVPPF